MDGAGGCGSKTQRQTHRPNHTQKRATEGSAETLPRPEGLARVKHVVHSQLLVWTMDFKAVSAFILTFDWLLSWLTTVHSS